MRVLPETILSAGDMSQASLTSLNISLNQLSSVSIQCVFTGAPSGTIKLQFSVDATTWTDDADSSYTIAAAGDLMYLVNKMPAQYVRSVYTKSGGTGSLTIKVFGKEI